MKNEQLYGIIYRSLAKLDFDFPKIYKMLSNSREFNASANITGCLLYHDHHFLQMIEGEQKVVTDLYQRIQADERHHQVQTIRHEAIAERMFMDWSMAFFDFGLGEHSRNYKAKEIDFIYKKSFAFSSPNDLGLEYFNQVREILFLDPDNIGPNSI